MDGDQGSVERNSGDFMTKKDISIVNTEARSSTPTGIQRWSSLICAGFGLVHFILGVMSVQLIGATHQIDHYWKASNAIAPLAALFFALGWGGISLLCWTVSLAARGKLKRGQFYLRVSLLVLVPFLLLPIDLLWFRRSDMEVLNVAAHQLVMPFFSAGFFLRCSTDVILLSSIRSLYKNREFTREREAHSLDE